MNLLFPSVRQLAHRLSKKEVSEKTSMWHTLFLAIIGMLTAYSYMTGIPELTGNVEIISYWVSECLIWGSLFASIPLMYRANSSGDNQDFAKRYTSLALSIFWQYFVIALIIFLIFFGIVLILMPGSWFESDQASLVGSACALLFSFLTAVFTTGSLYQAFQIASGVKK